MKAVVTGSAGFIGKHLFAALENKGWEVVGIDLKTGDDILTCGLPEADAAFHLAAQTDAYFQDAEADAAVNIMGALRVFRRYRDRTVFASSSMVNYPTTPYAISKYAAEQYAALYGVSVVRFCNIIGPGGHSVFDRFSEAEELTIYGTGEQRRTYAHIAFAVDALMARLGMGGVFVLAGAELSVNDIADRFPGKPRRYVPARQGDMIEGRQVLA